MSKVFIDKCNGVPLKLLEFLHPNMTMILVERREPKNYKKYREIRDEGHLKVMQNLIV